MNRIGKRKRGFTLIEVLLVAAIIGVVAAVTLPALARSIQGNRLRAASRTVVMAGKYARSMSLLAQKEIDVVFDPSAGRVHIRDVRPAGGAMGARRAGGGGANGPPEPAGDAAATMEADGAEAGAGGVVRAPGETVRELDRVKIAYIQVEGATGGRASAAKGEVFVRYRSNGTCTPYEVRLEDEDGRHVTVRVDMLGGVETEG